MKRLRPFFFQEPRQPRVDDLIHAASRVIEHRCCSGAYDLPEAQWLLGDSGSTPTGSEGCAHQRALTLPARRHVT